MADDPILSDFNGLARAEPSLPVSWYSCPEQFAREMAAVWRRGWLAFCRSDEIAPQGYRAGRLAGANLLVARRADGGLQAFHNVCRHRGAELCAEGAGALERPMIVCPYHRWTYDLAGRLIATGPARGVEGFDRAEHGLIPAGVAEWGGYVFVNAAGGDQAGFEAEAGPELALMAHWPLGDMVLAHREEIEVACNWKVFWENFNECLHCPGVHPSLCEMVPIYGRGIMVPEDDPDWRGRVGATDPRLAGGLRAGAETWADGGRAQGAAALPGLTAEDVARGHTYGVTLPSFFVVGHVDYARTVRVVPLAPERTRLTADWLLPTEWRASGTDLAPMVDFAARVLAEDAAACEMNQRGLSAAPFERGTLMQEEYEVYAFHRWVKARLGEGAPLATRASRREA